MPNKELLQKMLDELPEQLGRGYLLDGNKRYCAVGFGLHVAGIPDSQLFKCRTTLMRADDPSADELLAEELGVLVEAINDLYDLNDCTPDMEQRLAKVREWLIEQLSTTDTSSQTP